MNERTTKNNPLEAEKEEKKRSSPNILSEIFICWVCPILFKGNRRDIEEEDLIRPSVKYDSEGLGDALERYWLDEYKSATEQNRAPRLWKAMWKTYWLAFAPGGLLLMGNFATRTVQPLLFAELLMFWSTDANMSQRDAGFYALGMLALNFLGVLCQHHNSLFMNRFSLRVKVASSSLLYKKLLRLSQVSVSDVAAGKLVNLLSNDINRFEFFFMFAHYIWLVPLQASVVLYLLYTTAGFAPFVGLFGVILLIVPFQAILTKFTAIIRRKTAQRTDRRIKLMNEIINGIQVIKMYAWEKPFETIVNNVRAYEMSALWKSILIRSVFIGFMMFTERTILFVTALTLILTGEMVTANTMYPIQQFLSIIQMNFTLILPLAIAGISELKVSLERIQEFLVLDEREDLSLMHPNKISDYKVKEKILPIGNNKTDNSVLVQNTNNEVGRYAVDIDGVSASWNDAADANVTLKDITIKVEKGKLCAVIGPVGSGKSSLLQVLLKELPIQKGRFSVEGSISYACQMPWLYPATVRENIIFGRTYDPKKYRQVCKACCLMPDFKQFPYGDLSLVGERGVSLSGGQRARISLARAVYQDADIYLLDDPLSAVDANVGRSLFEGCMKGYLRGRTCILVTHQIHFLQAADQIVVLNEGVVENAGTYDDLLRSEKKFTMLLSNLQESKKKDEDELAGEKKPSIRRDISRLSTRSDASDFEGDVLQTLDAEERAKGSLKWAVVQSYFSAVSSFGIVLLALGALLVTQAIATSTDYFLSFWTNQVQVYEDANGQIPDTALDYQVGVFTNGQYLLIYGCIVLGLIIFAHVRITTFAWMTMRASKNLHKAMYSNLSKAVMRFFETNPSGRILNRFSKDMGSMDELLPRNILETFQMYLSMTSILVLNAIALPWTLIPTAVLVVMFMFYLKWYLNSAQAVKRLEGTTKSPVFGMISSSIEGLSTIRSSKSQDRFQRIFDEAQNLHSSAFYTYLGSASAFGLYLDLMSLLYLAIIYCIFIFIDFGEAIPVGSVGLAVSQTMVLTIVLQMAARFTADFLGQMTAVERVLEYTKLPHEENLENGPTKVPLNWPDTGNIKFENVCLKYAPDSANVLNNLCFEIQSGWKVGIVGRTGAGKSSLISALFRLADIEGNIKLDEIDTRGIAKQDLRAKISIIPQEPVLFSASLRYNLDPFNVYSDEELWKSLEQVELKESIPALDYKVTEGGSNFSVGQRQLICLARAILRSNKILVMDEATANVDPQTDELIQKTIRKQFETCTVLTIAHRLNTIMDSDRVLVMDRGEVFEFDHPYLLLQNSNSKFSSMVMETGENMFKVLFEVAKAKYLKDNSDKGASKVIPVP